MAVIVNQAAGVIEVNANGDEVAMPIFIKSIRFVSEAGQLATDTITLVDPQAPTEELWKTYGFAAQATEAELIEKMWHNGFRVLFNPTPADRGELFISYQ